MCTSEGPAKLPLRSGWDQLSQGSLGIRVKDVIQILLALEPASHFFSLRITFPRKIEYE